MTFEKSYDIPVRTPETYAAWLSSDTVISPAKRMHIVPKVGGAYQMFMQDAGNTPSCQGVFSEVFSNSRLRYSWQWAGTAEKTDITVTFLPTTQGTRITVIHQGFDTAESCTRHATGWDNYIEGLTDFLQVAELHLSS